METPLPSTYRLKPPFSPHVISVFLVFFAVLLSFFGGSAEQVIQTAPIAFSMFLIAIAGWIIASQNPIIGSWFLLMGFCLVVLMLDLGLRISGSIVLFVIPPLAAFATVGRRAGIILSISQSFTLLIILFGGISPANPALIGFTLLLIWCETLVLWFIFQSANQDLDWSWQQYQHARETLAEAREQRAQTQQAIENLEVANRQLALMNDKISQFRLIAEEAEKTKANFVANVSHEFRTPLNMIIGLIDFMLVKPEIYGGALPELLRKDLETVQRSCEHLSALINDVLDLSRIEAGRLALRKERVDIAEIIERAIQVILPLIEKKSLEIKSHIPANIPLIYCDRTRIRQVVVNLLSNAARATDHGYIQIDVQQIEQDILVSITDTGPGIDPLQANRLFEPFFQGEPGRSNIKGGSGLGLAISKNFIELHQGKIWFESSPGKGSTFYFRLPINPPVGPEEPPERWIVADWEWRKHPVGINLTNQPLIPRIIVCDETGDLYASIHRYADVFEPVETHTLDDAVAEAERKSALALIINTAVPISLYEQVERARQLLPDLPIIGCALPPKIQHPLSASVLDYLLKPVTQSDIEEAIYKVNQPVHQILLVEDDLAAQELFARMIKACDQNLEILTASTGMEAMARLKDTPIDLVLLDVVLPDVDGWQLVALKNEDPAIREIPIVMLSAQNPVDSPLESRILMTSIGSGLSMGKILRLVQILPPLLLQPD